MALLHDATLVPSKIELLTAWLPGASWFTGRADSAGYAMGLRRLR
jgi:hypothetical protein